MPAMLTDGSWFDSDGVQGASASAAALFSCVLLNTTTKMPAANATTATTAAMVSQGRPCRRETTGAGVRLFFVLLPLTMMRVRSLLFDAGSKGASAGLDRSAGWPVADGPVYVPRPWRLRERGPAEFATRPGGARPGGAGCARAPGA